MTDPAPLDVGELVRQLGASQPFRLLEVARGHLAGVERVEAVNLLLVDYGQKLLSDGVLEAAPEGGSAYGAVRLEALLRATRVLAPYEVARLVVDEVIAHRAGDLADDLTAVCLDWRRPAS